MSCYNSTNDIPRDQKVCPKCGETCNYETCECPYECLTGQEPKVDIEEYRERARGLLADHKLTLRSCWECNSAHEHLKEGEDIVLLCFGCGHYYLGAVKL